VTPHVRLAERFVLLRETADDYRVLSAFESIVVRTQHGSDELLDRVLPLLRKGAAQEDLRSAAGDGAGQDLDMLLEELHRRGLIEPFAAPERSHRRDAGEDEPVALQQRFLANFMVYQERPPDGAEMPRPNGEETQCKLADADVLLIGDGQLAQRTAAQLTRAGVGRVQTLAAQTAGSDDSRLEHAIGDGDVVVVCPDLHRVSLLRAVNTSCLALGRTWTSARTLGGRVEIGPTVVPGESACFGCYEHRRQANDPGYRAAAETAERLALLGVDTGRLAIEAADGILAAELLKIISGFSRPMTYGALFTLDLVTLESGLHPVLKIPRCASCGAPARNRPTTAVWPFAS
jgi:bacteriocin biosynthesis cyclodehydratase domain-containing protein